MENFPYMTLLELQMMMQKIAPIFLICAIIGSAVADDAPLLSYHNVGGFSSYKEVGVTISASGSATVMGQKEKLPPVEYRTELSPEEIATISTLIRSTEFFSQPAKDTRYSTCVGHTVLTINWEGNSRTLTYRYRPSLGSLSNFIWKLITQAFTIKAIESDGDIRAARCTLMPGLSGTKALQPSALKAPLKSYIRAHDNVEKVGWALEALAWTMTPEEYCGFISKGLQERQQREIFLSIIGTYSFQALLPDSHKLALCPVYLICAREFIPRYPQLSNTEKEALTVFLSMLGEAEYRPAIALLKQCFDAHDQPYLLTIHLRPLVRMGVDSLKILIQYLGSPKEMHRINAIYLIVIMSGSGPDGDWGNPLLEREFNRMIPVFAHTVIPQLRYLSENDASLRVRNNAKSGLEKIETLIKSKGAPTSTEPTVKTPAD